MKVFLKNTLAQSIALASHTLLSAWSSDWTQNVCRDVKSLRVMAKVAYSIFYFWLVVYCVKHNPDSMNTAITCTAGLVGTIAAGYMATKTYEKIKNGNHRPPVPDASEEEDESGD
ncbi:MAG: hypothetical protein HY547_03210 [Elusimicrobia bacterium]|nr:hypothetical protein [Elusimicrobiota bacterium]